MHKGGQGGGWPTALDIHQASISEMDSIDIIIKKDNCGWDGGDTQTRNFKMVTAGIHSKEKK